jgi:Tfp pilus assembly protein PilN
MTRQINLLTLKRTSVRLSAAHALAAITLMLVVVAGMWVAAERDNRQRAAVLATQQAQLREAAEALKVLKAREAARRQPAQVQAEIDALRPLASLSEALLDGIANGSLGNPAGFVGHLTSLARTTEEGLWLTNVSLGSGGQKLALQGRALESAAVLRYVQRLNAQFETHGAGVSTLDITASDTKEGAVTTRGVSFRMN